MIGHVHKQPIHCSGEQQHIHVWIRIFLMDFSNSYYESSIRDLFIQIDILLIILYYDVGF
jgi:hypothetical protein